MTISQAEHHSEQIAAAREEFNKWWDAELRSERLSPYGNQERIRFQIWAWRAFLKAKGLLK